MAITPTGQPVNRTNINLPNEVSTEILQKVQESSMIMQLARQISLPGTGLQIPVIASDPEAAWITEGGTKPVSFPTLDKKIMQGHKLAVIVPFSEEFRRDARALYDALVDRLPGVLAEKFDKTVFFGPTSGSLANFDNFSAITAVSLASSVYGGLVSADINVSEQGGMINGYVFSPQGRGMLLSALDGQNRPLFTTGTANGDIPGILGAPTHFTKSAYKAGAAASGSDPAVPDVVGFAGDWTHAMYGIVSAMNVSISDQATLTYTDANSQTVTLNLWQQNMFAVRAEIEVGFAAETAYFNALTRTHSA